MAFMTPSFPNFLVYFFCLVENKLSCGELVET